MKLKSHHKGGNVSTKPPTSDYEFPNKDYVDTLVTSHIEDPVPHITVAERQKLAGIPADATSNIGDVTLTDIQTLTNKTLESPTLTGAAVFGDEYVVPVTAASVYVNFANGNKQRITLTRNVTLFLSAPGIGTYQLIVYQDGTGNRTLSWNGITLYLGSATAPPVKTTANSRTFYTLYYNGSEFYLAGSRVGG